MECTILLKPSSFCEKITDHTRFRWVVCQLDAIREDKKISLSQEDTEIAPKDTRRDVRANPVEHPR